MLRARIRVVVATLDGERSIHALTGSGGSFGGSSLQQEIGLGNAERILELEISWPTSGTTQLFRDVPLDRFVEITEGEAELRIRERPSVEQVR